MRLSAIFGLVVSLASAGCLPIAGDRILGRHLAMADAALAALPASLTAGFSPAPGSTRIFAAAEIDRLAKANGVVLATPSAVCFEFAMHHLSPEAALAAMRAGLPETANIELVELPGTPAPVGELHFPVTSLEPGADSQLWRGYIQYTATRRSPVWARVRITNTMQALVLTSDVARGAPILPQSVERKLITGLSLNARVATSPAEVADTIARTPLKAGSPILLSTLIHPPTVRRGDVVQVDVRCGPAHLKLNAIAQKEARNGEIVELLNPASGKIFRARMEGARAILDIGGRL